MESIHSSSIKADASQVEHLERLVNELQVLNELSQSISSTLNVGEILDKIINNAIRVTHASQGSIKLVRDDQPDLLRTVVKGADRISREVTYKIDLSLTGWVLKNKRSLLVRDIHTDPAFKRIAERDPTLHSILSVPLVVKDRIIGVLNLTNKKTGAGFDDGDLRLITIIASQSAQLLENANLFEEVNELFINTITALAAAVDERDPYTKGHSQRVSDYSVGIATELGLSAQEIADVKLAALLHDVGKIGIPDYILKKEGRLTDEEFEIMKTHPMRGIKIIQSVKQLAKVFVGVRNHHERIDGNGYPDGISGASIGLQARIIAAADTVDAMTTDRPYRKALPLETAKSELLRHSGTQFDPMVVQAFLAFFDKSGERQPVRQVQTA